MLGRLALATALVAGCSGRPASAPELAPVELEPLLALSPPPAPAPLPPLPPLLSPRSVPRPPPPPAVPAPPPPLAVAAPAPRLLSAEEPPPLEPLALTAAPAPSPARARPAPAITHHLLAGPPPPRRYGVMLDVGVPDGATAALVYRPTRALRLDAGLSYNGVSHGVRAGVTLVPLATWITPTLSVAAGHFAEGDANPLARLVMGDPTIASPALEHVGYDYADAEIGVELGRRRATVFLRAGATRVTGNLHDLSATLSGMGKPPVTFAADPQLTVTALSARLGLILYFGAG